MLRDHQHCFKEFIYGWHILKQKILLVHPGAPNLEFYVKYWIPETGRLIYYSTLAISVKTFNVFFFYSQETLCFHLLQLWLIKCGIFALEIAQECAEFYWRETF